MLVGGVGMCGHVCVTHIRRRCNTCASTDNDGGEQGEGNDGRILVTKTQLEGTSPQVDNSDDDDAGGVRGKFGGSSGKLNGFLLAKRANCRSRSERGFLLAKRANYLWYDSFIVSSNSKVTEPKNCPKLTRY